MPENVDASVDSFRTRWTELEAAIKAALQRLHYTDDSHKSELKKSFDMISTMIFQLDHLVSQAAHSLPAFELWKHSTVSKQLRSDMADMRCRKLPRHKFEFTDASKIILVEDPLAQGIRVINAEEKSTDATSTLDVCECISDDTQTTISNLSGVEHVVHTDQLRGKAWTLSDLKDCTLYLHGPMQALYLHRLENCRVEAGPVHSATFGEELQHCSLSLVSHQLRLHASSSLQVYLRAGSDPIIEDCSGIGFGPLTSLAYEGFDELCHAADLHADGTHWQHVKDFLNPGSHVEKNWYTIKADS